MQNGSPQTSDLQLVHIAENGYPVDVSCSDFSHSLSLLCLATHSGDLKIYGKQHVQFSYNFLSEVKQVPSSPDTISITVPETDYEPTNITHVKFISEKVSNCQILTCLNSSNLAILEIENEQSKNFSTAEWTTPTAQHLTKTLEYQPELADDEEITTISKSLENSILFTSSSGKLTCLSRKNNKLFSTFSTTLPGEDNESINSIEFIHPEYFFLTSFNRVLFFNIRTKQITQTTEAYGLTSISCLHDQAEFFTSTQKGRINLHCYVDYEDQIEHELKESFQPWRAVSKSTTPISKITNGKEYYAYAGGLPKTDEIDYQDMNTITTDKIRFFNSKKTAAKIYYFTSKIIDFHILFHNKQEYLLAILERELVMIDLETGSELPPAYSQCLQASCITELNASVIKSSKSKQDFQWPVSGGELVSELNGNELIESKYKNILITGHENGQVHLYEMNNSHLILKEKINSASFFLEYEEPDFGRYDFIQDRLPLQNAGVYDPFTDDDRLAITRVAYKGEILATGSKGGHVIIFIKNHFSKKPIYEKIDILGESRVESFKTSQQPCKYSGHCTAYPNGATPRNRHFWSLFD